MVAVGSVVSAVTVHDAPAMDRLWSPVRFSAAPAKAMTSPASILELRATEYNFLVAVSPSALVPISVNPVMNEVVESLTELRVNRLLADAVTKTPSPALRPSEVENRKELLPSSQPEILEVVFVP